MTRHTSLAKNSGIALVSVIIFSAVAMIVITAAISVSVLANLSSRQFLQGQQALYVAQAGAENALLRYLRNPSYAGETLTLTEGTATITLSGANPKIILVTGRAGTAVRKLEVQVTTNTGVNTVTSWQEQF